MSINKVEFKNKKAHLRYDPDRHTYVGYRVDVRAGRRRFRNTFKTKVQAERFIDDLRTRAIYREAGLKYKASADVSLRELFDRRLAQLKNPKEIVRATRIFELFEMTFDYPPKVTAVRPANIQSYINERLATGVKPETVDREVTILSGAFSQASVLFPEELEDFEPPRIPRPRYKKGKRRRRVITEAEKDAIVAAILAPPVGKEHPVRAANRQVTARIFEIGWLLGLRFSEVTGLAKADFDRKARTLRVTRWKTDTVTLVEFLPDQIIEVLAAAADASTSEKIFDLTCSEPVFTGLVRTACRDLGITYGRGMRDGITFHSTRHSFASRATKATDIATAGELTGHSSGKMVDYYSQPTEESKRLVMEKMYGNGRRDSLVKIFEEIRSGEMDLEAFLTALE